MASVQEYCEMLSTSQLHSLLREECEGRGAMPAEMILLICDILSQRDPTKPDAREMLLRLCACYLEEKR